VQVNHPQYPNKLLFTTGISAVMLDAPAVADATGHYTVATTVDPVVGDTASGEWGSIMLSRSRNSAGYVTNADVDLGLTVQSNGHLDLFNAGTHLWSASVAAATSYTVSATVSTGADRTVVLVVNGSTFTITAPSSVGRWPSTPYVYLGAYLSGSEVTTFGSGQPGQGLSVSHVDTSVPASSKIFVDTFDGSTDSDPTGYGLDDGLRARQPAVVASGYTRTSGQPNTSAAPPAWDSQVNHPSYPNRLSFWSTPSAIRLNRPVTADLDQTYAVHAVLDPVANGNDRSSPEWLSLILSGSGAANGFPTTADVDLGLTVRSSGHVQLYQHGNATWGTEPAISPAADGTFDVTFTVATGTGGVSILINGTVLNVTAASALSRTAYLYVGSYNTNGSTVSTVDDLRVSMLGGLDYYGYWDVMDPTDHVNHADSVASYTNLNLYLEAASPHAYLDYCRPRTCVFNIQWQQFQENSAGTGLVLGPDSAANVAALRADVGSNLDKVGAIYLIDEPYGDWSERRVSAADLQTATDQVRHNFPSMLLMLTLDGASVGVAKPPAIPQQIDMVGFDWYCFDSRTLTTTLNTLQSRLTPYQHMYLIPESATSLCAGSTDTSIAARQSVYQQLAAANTRVVAILNFGWWLGGAGEPNPFTDLPGTAQAQANIGANIINPR